MIREFQIEAPYKLWFPIGKMDKDRLSFRQRKAPCDCRLGGGG